MITTDPSQWRGRIVIAGTGGQGVITTSRVLCDFFADRGAQVVSGQVHGMSQRGGAVQSVVMVNSGISPVMRPGTADFVLGLEPIECARTVPLLSPTAVVYMNVAPIVPVVISQACIHSGGEARYPELSALTDVILEVTPHLVTMDVTAIARDLGDVRLVNTTLLGCLFGSGLVPWSPDEFAHALRASIPEAMIDKNLRAYHQGVARTRGEAPLLADRLASSDD